QIEIRALAISNANGGAFMLNLHQCGSVIGINYRRVPAILHEGGVLVKRYGRTKMVDVFDLAEFLGRGRVAPIDNR
ncbi:MAG: hypothetical protein LBK23_02890, partial [Oscillospiraceae bacterium]|nr:hypothetical protein [Oscillospiraceae bacterium]